MSSGAEIARSGILEPVPDRLRVPLVGDVQALFFRLAGITVTDGTNTAPSLPYWEWEMLSLALKAAVGRFHDTLESGRVLETRAAVREALWWIAASDEYLRRRVSAGVSRTRYYNELGTSEPGRRLGALCFLRNRAGHQLALVLAHHAPGEPVPFRIEQDDGSISTSEVAFSYSWLPNPYGPAEAELSSALSTNSPTGTPDSKRRSLATLGTPT